MTASGCSPSWVWPTRCQGEAELASVKTDGHRRDVELLRRRQRRARVVESHGHRQAVDHDVRWAERRPPNVAIGPRRRARSSASSSRRPASTGSRRPNPTSTRTICTEQDGRQNRTVVLWPAPVTAGPLMLRLPRPSSPGASRVRSCEHRVTDERNIGSFAEVIAPVGEGQQLVS